MSMTMVLFSRTQLVWLSTLRFLQGFAAELT